MIRGEMGKLGVMGVNGVIVETLVKKENWDKLGKTGLQWGNFDKIL